MLSKFNLANTVLVGMSQAVSVRPDRCGRMCHKNYECTLCETNCPMQAIMIGAVGTNINVNWDKCSYCGICVNICPTGVYGVREISYSSFLDTYLQKLTDKGRIKLSCKENLKQNKNEESVTGGNIRSAAEKPHDKEDSALLECMGILGMPDILYLYLYGAKEIYLDFPKCVECQNRYGREIFEDELDELIKLAEYFENLKDVQITRTNSEIKIIFPKQFEKKIVSITEENAVKRAQQVTRRGIFDILRQNATDTALRSASLLTPQEIPSRTLFNDKKEVPVKRKIFLNSIIGLGKLLKEEISVGSYFFSMRIDSEKCTFCKVCTRFCLTGALSVSEDGKQILFTAAYCVSCGMCKISCYQKYIKTDKTVYLKDFFSETVKATTGLS